MKNRIKEIRAYEKLTQEAFAKRLKLTRNFIAQIETGSKEPSARTIGDICREFDVSETWLRTGAGKMHDGMTRAEEMTAEVSKLMSTRPDSFKASVVNVLLKFEPDGPEWTVLENIYNSIEKETGKRE